MIASSSESERWVLCSMLSEPACIPDVLRLVRSRDYADDAHRALFDAIVARHRSGEPIDVALISQELRESPNVDDAVALLTGIAETATTSAHALHYARLIHDASQNRRIIDAAEEALDSAKNGGDAAGRLNDLLSFAEDELRAIQSPQSLERFTLAELVEKHPKLHPPVVDGLFRKSESVNVVSSSKIGKSWLVYSLALAIVRGEPWLDRFNTTTGKVLLIDNELHKTTLANRIPKVGDAMGIARHEYERNLEIWPLRGNLRSLEELAVEFDRIEPGEYAAIILDAKYRFAVEGVSENDNSSETLFYNKIDQIAEKTQAAIVLVHHSSKGSQSEKRVTDVGSGAGAQSRATDCHLVLREHEEADAVVLDAAVRSFPPVDPVVLRWEFPIWKADHDGNPALLKGKAASQSKKAADKERIAEEQRETDRTKVWAAMNQLKGAETTSMIAGAASIPNGRTTAAIGWLVAERLVQKAGVRRDNNQIYPGFELTKEGRHGANQAA